MDISEVISLLALCLSIFLAGYKIGRDSNITRKK